MIKVFSLVFEHSQIFKTTLKTYFIVFAHSNYYFIEFDVLVNVCQTRVKTLETRYKSD